jgi:GABA(A) receptor-associated protein
MEKSLNERIIYSQRLLSKYPDRIPLVIEKTEFIELENYKYLLPRNLLVSEFMCIIKTKMNKALDEKKAIFTFVKSNACSVASQSPKEIACKSSENYILIPMSETVENVYNIHKNSDGFLYIKFGVENTFG